MPPLPTLDARSLSPLICYPKFLVHTGAHSRTTFVSVALHYSPGNSGSDVIGIILDVAEPCDKHQQRNSPSTNAPADRVQEVVILTEEKLPTWLTLWKELVDAEGALFTSIAHEQPIVAALHVNASSFAGISLSAMTMANFIDPPYADKELLVQWKLNNGAFIADAVLHKTYFQTAPARHPTIVDVSTIAHIQASNKICKLRNKEIKNTPFHFHIKKRSSSLHRFESSAYTVIVTWSSNTANPLLTGPPTPSKGLTVSQPQTGLTPDIREKATCKDIVQLSLTGTSHKSLLPLLIDHAATPTTSSKRAATSPDTSPNTSPRAKIPSSLALRKEP